MRRQELPAGARLMALDTEGDSAYVIRHGAVKVHVELEDGRDVIVAILGPGEIVGEMSIVDRETRSGSVVTLDVHGRIAHHLLVLAEEYGEAVDGGTRIPIRLTQGDLASLVGASRVRANQALVMLKRKGAISTNQHHHITVHKEDVLAASVD